MQEAPLNVPCAAPALHRPNLVAEVVQQQLRVQVHARSTPRRELVRLPLRLKSMKPRRLSAAREQ